MRGKSNYTLYWEAQIYLEPVSQEINALRNSW
jgi:hypothetical protein